MELTEEEYCKDLIPPLNSIKNHVIHSILAVEYNLRVRVDGEKADPYEISDAITCMTIQEAMQHWEIIVVHLHLALTQEVWERGVQV